MLRSSCCRHRRLARRQPGERRGVGATDSRWLRAAGIPSYEVSGLFFGESRAHGRDERIGVNDLYAGRRFLHRLVEELATAP